MWKPIYQPEPWPQFVKRKEIAPLPLMEQRRKHMEEQMLFENYISSVNTMNTLNAGAAGGPSPDPSYVLTNATIQAASALWFTNQALAEERYGLIGNWDVSRVTEFEDVFSVVDNPGVLNTFNEDISGWNMSNATDLQEMFQGQTLFNQDLSNWDVSNVTNFNDTFKECAAYNNGGVNLNGWDVSSATNMSGMFDQASVFNQAIGDWDTRNVTTFSKMFKDAAAFNQSIDTVTSDFQAVKWCVDQSTDMSDMFSGALAFDQDIQRWLTNGNQPGAALWTTAARMFGTPGAADAVTLSVANYNVLLIGWKNGLVPQNISFSGGNSKYDAALAISARQGFIDDEGWTIVDGGEV
jgi:surface protein